jgi:hypothetical protein
MAYEINRKRLETEPFIRLKPIRVRRAVILRVDRDVGDKLAVLRTRPRPTILAGACASGRPIGPAIRPALAAEIIVSGIISAADPARAGCGLLAHTAAHTETRINCREGVSDVCFWRLGISPVVAIIVDLKPRFQL